MTVERDVSPATEAGRALRTLLFGTYVRKGFDADAAILAIEQEAGGAMGEREEPRLPFPDELAEADHEIAGFLHPMIWGDVHQHDTEPGDGSDCHECYAYAGELAALISETVARLSVNEGGPDER